MKIWMKMSNYIGRKSKSVIAMLVAVTMLLSVMPMSAFASGEIYWDDPSVQEAEKQVTVLLSELTEGASGDGWTYENETLTLSEANYAYTLEGGTFNGILKNYGFLENATVKAIAQDDGSFIGGVTYNYGKITGGSYEDMHNYGRIEGVVNVYRELLQYGDTPAYLYNYEGGTIYGKTDYGDYDSSEGNGFLQYIADKGGIVEYAGHVCYREYVYDSVIRYFDSNAHLVYYYARTPYGVKMSHVCEFRLQEHTVIESGEFAGFCYSQESDNYCKVSVCKGTHAVCGDTVCSADHNADGIADEHASVSWKELPTSTNIDEYLVQIKDGNYHYTDNSYLGDCGLIEVSGHSSLCISNSYSGKESIYIPYVTVDVKQNATLDLCACSRNVKIQCSHNYVKGTLNVYEGVTIESYYSTGETIVVEEGGTLNIYGATIVGNIPIKNYGTVNIYGGDIKGEQLGIQNCGTGTVRLFGDVQISCNEEPDFGEDWNSGLYLEPGSKLYVDKLTPNSKINLGVLGFGEFTIEGGADYIDCFYGVSDEQFAVADNGEDLISRRLSPITLEYSGVYGTDFSYTQEVYVVKGNDVPKPDF